MSKKILIIEDDLLLSSAISTALKDEKYQVFLAQDGLIGLTMAKKHKPDLILCDINMPKLDGLTMLKKMRSTEWGSSISVMILTNYSDEERVLEALRSSVFSYLVKSDWDLKQIISRIKKQLGD